MFTLYMIIILYKNTWLGNPGYSKIAWKEISAIANVISAGKYEKSLPSMHYQWSLTKFCFKMFN